MIFKEGTRYNTRGYKTEEGEPSVVQISNKFANNQIIKVWTQTICRLMILGLLVPPGFLNTAIRLGLSN